MMFGKTAFGELKRKTKTFHCGNFRVPTQSHPFHPGNDKALWWVLLRDHGGSQSFNDRLDFLRCGIDGAPLDFSVSCLFARVDYWSSEVKKSMTKSLHVVTGVTVIKWPTRILGGMKRALWMNVVCEFGWNLVFHPLTMYNMTNGNWFSWIFPKISWPPSPVEASKTPGATEE